MSTTQKLIEELCALGLSQSEIARRTDIPQPRLCRWSAGEVPKGADGALRLMALHTELTASKPATEKA